MLSGFAAVSVETGGRLLVEPLSSHRVRTFVGWGGDEEFILTAAADPRIWLDPDMPDVDGDGWPEKRVIDTQLMCRSVDDVTMHALASGLPQRRVGWRRSSRGHPLTSPIVVAGVDRPPDALASVESWLRPSSSNPVGAPLCPRLDVRWMHDGYGGFETPTRSTVDEQAARCGPQHARPVVVAVRPPSSDSLGQLEVSSAATCRVASRDGREVVQCGDDVLRCRPATSLEPLAGSGAAASLHVEVCSGSTRDWFVVSASDHASRVVRAFAPVRGTRTRVRFGTWFGARTVGTAELSTHLRTVYDEPVVSGCRTTHRWTMQRSEYARSSPAGERIGSVVADHQAGVLGEPTRCQLPVSGLDHQPRAAYRIGTKEGPIGGGASLRDPRLIAAHRAIGDALGPLYGLPGPIQFPDRPPWPFVVSEGADFLPESGRCPGVVVDVLEPPNAGHPGRALVHFDAEAEAMASWIEGSWTQRVTRPRCAADRGGE